MLWQCLFVVPESRNPDPGRVDVLGVLLSVAGLVLVVYGIIQGGDTGAWLRWDVLGPAVGGLAVLVLFGWHETRISHPSLDVRLFRDPRLSASVGAIALVFFPLAGAIFFISFYMQNVRGYSPLHAGLLTLPLAAGQMLFSPRSATLVRRFGAKVVTTIGLLLVAVALAGYHFLGADTPIWVLGVIFFVQGAGMANVMPPATEAVMSVLPRERAGAGSSLNNTARQVSVALGVAVLGSILAQVYRSQLGPHLAGLPATARATATASITGAQSVAQQLGPAGNRLLAPASDAFVNAMHVTSLISAADRRRGRDRGVRLDARDTRPCRGAGPAKRARARARARTRAGNGRRSGGRVKDVKQMTPAAVRPVMLVDAQGSGPAGSAAHDPDSGAGASRRPGRPRSEEADRAIIDAALDLFAESGAGGLCIEAVAARAGVGKSTIYRRWPGKEDLLVDALATLKARCPSRRASRCAMTWSRCCGSCAMTLPTRGAFARRACCMARASSTRG